MTTHSLCSLQYDQKRQVKDYLQCADRIGRRFYDAIAIGDDPRGRYVFARLAEREFAAEGLLKFSYSPLPQADQDMRLIHEGLAVALEAGEEGAKGGVGVFSLI